MRAHPTTQFVITLLLTSMLMLGCEQSSTPQATQEQPKRLTPHEKMRALLASIAEEAKDQNAFVGDAHARKLRTVMGNESVVTSMTPERKWELYFELGKAELRLGNEERALELLETALEIVPEGHPELLKRTHFELGLTALRHGETQNCCLLHSGESCIVPIRGQGLHKRTEGSQKAITYFTKVLEQPAPEDAEDERLEVDEAARWLLNIAYMTLDQYPDGVPEQYRVSPKFFEAETEFPRFENVYPKLKLDTFNMCGGAVVDDFDGDGDLDIVTCTWDVTGQTQVFRNNGNGTFDEVTEESGLTGFFGGLNLNQTDFDNDGDLDIFIMRGAWLKEEGDHPNSLLRNDGDLKFTDVTLNSGLGGDLSPTKTSAWADYDNDGDLDLYVGNETSEETDAPCHLYRNDDGLFVDVSIESGLGAHVFSMGSAWGDYNNDGWPDLFISVVGPNLLYRNNKDGTFTNVAEALNVTEPLASFPTWFWDYNNDGHLDLFVSATSGPIGVLDTDIRFELMHVYRNKGDGTFEDQAEKLNLHYPAQPMGANFGDINMDGFLDFYLATGNTPYSEIRPNVMFLNDRGERFQNVTMAGGFGHLQKGHGVSFADIDNDGDQDVYVQLGGAYPGDRYNDALFENPGFDRHSVTIHLVGTKSNRAAIGARLQLEITEADGTKRSVFHHVTSGSSFGANPLRQAIGIGTAEKVDRLTITWPILDSVQTFENLDANKAYRIVEGEKPVEFELKPMKIGE